MSSDTTAKLHHNDSRFVLTHLKSLCNHAHMLRSGDIRHSLEQQLFADGKELSKLNDEMKALRQSYIRYLDLLDRAKRTEERLIDTASLMYQDEDIDVDNMNEFLTDHGVKLESVSEAKPNLWRYMREIVRQVPEIQVVELEHLIQQFNITASRAAIESALETHKDVFRIVRKGRQKFVALK